MGIDVTAWRRSIGYFNCTGIPRKSKPVPNDIFVMGLLKLCMKLLYGKCAQFTNYFKLIFILIILIVTLSLLDVCISLVIIYLITTLALFYSLIVSCLLPLGIKACMSPLDYTNELLRFRVMRCVCCSIMFILWFGCIICFVPSTIQTLLAMCGDIEPNPGPDIDNDVPLKFMFSNINSIGARYMSRFNALKERIEIGNFKIVGLCEVGNYSQHDIKNKFNIDGFHPPIYINENRGL
ncbi:unnamed protein product, partial [Owenia fusiformis]